YRLASSLAAMIGLVSGPLQSVVYPDLSKLWAREQREEMWLLVRRLALRVGLPLGGLAVIGALIAPWVVPVLVGDKYLPTGPALVALLLGGAVRLAFFWIRPAFLAVGRVRDFAALNLGSTIVNMAGFVVTIPLWGFVGLAWWLALSQSVAHVVLVAWLAGAE